MLKAVVFDRDGVLADFDLRSARTTLEPLLGVPLETFERFLRTHATQVPLPIDGPSEDAFWSALWTRFAHEHGMQADALTALQQFVPHSLLQLYPDALRALHRARAWGLRVGVLSNFSLLDLQRSLTALGIDHLIDAARSAATLGVAKPAREAYLAIASALGVAPSECLFVDNRVALVEGARAVGMHAVWLDRDPSHVGEQLLRSLDEVAFETSPSRARMPGFYLRTLAERQRALIDAGLCNDDDRKLLATHGALSPEIADRMIENAIGSFELPLGLGLNLRVNGRDRVIPMAVEEPSVIAAVSSAAKLVRDAGGFAAHADPSLMWAQVQLTQFGDVDRAHEAVLQSRDEILALANSFHPSLEARGGGARELEIKLFPAPEGPEGEPIFVINLLVDVQDAMGANLLNTMAEGVAPLIEARTGGTVMLRILSNLADRRLARATCAIPIPLLATETMDGARVAHGIVQASRFADVDPHRAATHNKGVMNGVDAVAIATGNDWRAIEAGAHAWAARSGRYMPLSQWRVHNETLHGRIELPLQVGIVGGPIRVHPIARIALKLADITSARELASVMAATGLAQNFAALRALGTVGIQRGHMALHARCVAVTAGARGAMVEQLAAMLVASQQVKIEKARELLGQLSLATPAL